MTMTRGSPSANHAQSSAACMQVALRLIDPGMDKASLADGGR